MVLLRAWRACKDSGGDGWADVWKRRFFAWEYKGKRANLDAAFDQLRQYALALENPPLLIVSDMERFRNWTNSVSVTHEFALRDLTDGATRDKLKWAMSDPERLRPGETRQTVTERAAATFAELVQGLRDQGHDPQEVAHFVNRLVFCMFAEDVGLLPDNMFTRMLTHARLNPARFADYASRLFGAMATGGDIDFQSVAWFNGGLFDDDTALPLDREGIETALKASALDWSEIDPSVLGTLFERGLDPEKRSQLGAHYTDRDKIMRIIDPVIVQPLLTERETAKTGIASMVEHAIVASSPTTRMRRRGQAEKALRAFLERLRWFTVLDPACGSGDFLYLALHALKDIEHRVQLEAETLGLAREFPAISPANVKGNEIKAYAAEFARVSVWIGEIQWMRRNGFSKATDPILDPLDTIECRDAILDADGSEPDWPQADVGNRTGRDVCRRTMTFASDRSPQEIRDRSNVRTHAQSRADVERLARPVPSTLRRELTLTTELRAGAHVWYRARSRCAYGGRRAQSKTMRLDVHSRVPTPHPGRLHKDEVPLVATSVTTTVRPRYRRPNGVLGDALPDDCRNRDTLRQPDDRGGTRMNKAELSARVAVRTSMSKPSSDADVSAVFSTIADALASGETERIAGFGTFSTKSQPARQGRNPRTGENIAIPASNTPAFKADKTLRDTVNY